MSCQGLKLKSGSSCRKLESETTKDMQILSLSLSLSVQKLLCYFVYF